MKTFVRRYGKKIRGVLAFWDRMLFKGSVTWLVHPEGVMSFLSWRGVLLKDFRAFVERQTDRLRKSAAAMAEANGRPYVYLNSPKYSKEAIAEYLVRRDGIKEGLVCVLSCVELSRSADIRKNAETRRLQVAFRDRPSTALYFYYVDREFGLMHVRLQTWLPYDVQVCINGREWLSRVFDEKGIQYERRDNCFAWIDDPERAQVLADELVDTNFNTRLTRFAKRVNPLMKDLLKETSYYWTVRQGEYATDVMFRDSQGLAEVYPHFVHHAITAFHSEDVMRFLGQKLQGNFTGEVTSNLRRRPEGVRVKHHVAENSIKMYDKQASVLRIETTINNPRRFKTRRRCGGKSAKKKRWLPMRKGIADIRRRAQISRAANARYLESLAVIPDQKPAAVVLDPVAKPVQVSPTQRYRAVRPIDPEEARFFASVMRGEFKTAGFRNRDLQALLWPNPTPDPKELKKRAGQITRRLRLLRAHGLITRVQGTHFYRVTSKGVAIMSTALHVRRANVYRLTKPA